MIPDRGKFTFDGRVGVLGSGPQKPACYDIVIPCKNGEEGFEGRARVVAEKMGDVIECSVVKNAGGGLEFHAKVRGRKEVNSGVVNPFSKDQIESAKLKLGIVKENNQEYNSCMIGQ